MANVHHRKQPVRYRPAPMAKGLTEAELKQLRTATKSLLTKPPYDGHGGQTRLAEDAGVQRATLSLFLDGQRGAGVKLLVGLQKVLSKHGSASTPAIPDGAAPVARDEHTPANPDVANDVLLKVYDDLCDTRKFPQAYPRELARYVLGQLRWRHKRALTYEEVLWGAKDDMDRLIEQGKWPPKE
jgi:hypothetical protein